ncbi:hypothetical protein AB0N79_36345 [Streptomyces microflavus]|uniref:hypothetical protein n=1 Tax=Streptomyces microflavus TaxID=1919 RepID=UPI00225C2F2C|nr:hypothetical protein [Streptomyces microflavus]MCX4657399.1 hypothetical protein [Streptomyces microflavus]
MTTLPHTNCSEGQQDEPGRCDGAAPRASTVYALIASLAVALLLYAAFDQAAAHGLLGPAGSYLLGLLPGVMNHAFALLNDVLAELISLALMAGAATIARRTRRTRRREQEGRSSATASTE